MPRLPHVSFPFLLHVIQTLGFAEAPQSEIYLPTSNHNRAVRINHLASHSKILQFFVLSLGVSH